MEIVIPGVIWRWHTSSNAYYDGVLSLSFVPAEYSRISSRHLVLVSSSLGDLDTPGWTHRLAGPGNWVINPYAWWARTILYDSVVSFSSYSILEVYRLAWPRIVAGTRPFRLARSLIGRGKSVVSIKGVSAAGAKQNRATERTCYRRQGK